MFHYKVWGTNGHSGYASGLATLISENSAIYEQMEGHIPANGPCRLTFEFKGNEVKVNPVSDCDHLGGTAVGLPGGVYKKSVANSSRTSLYSSENHPKGAQHE